MIQKIKSKRVELSSIYLIENEADFKELPKGLPFVIGSKDELEFITLFLEYQVLYKSCLALNLPLKWEFILKRLGYDISKMRMFELNSGGEYFESCFSNGTKIEISDFIEQQYLVNFDRLSELKILPKWLDDVKASIQVNIIDEVQFDPTAFNKQLGMNIGYGAVKTNMKNLIILDVSGSIPNSIVLAITQLAKLMSKKFYADIMITSSQTVLIDYDKVQSSDIVAISNSFSRGNEGEMYAKIIKEKKEYNTIISFGDDDSPQRFAKDNKEIINNFKVETLYSLHTNSESKEITGYAKIFKPKNSILVNDWVNTIN